MRLTKSVTTQQTFTPFCFAVCDVHLAAMGLMSVALVELGKQKVYQFVKNFTLFTS